MLLLQVHELFEHRREYLGLLLGFLFIFLLFLSLLVLLVLLLMVVGMSLLILLTMGDILLCLLLLVELLGLLLGHDTHLASRVESHLHSADSLKR